MPTNKLSHKLYREIVFWVGIIATFAYRVIVILNHYSQAWVTIAWYIGTIGFVWYFAHRFREENSRDRLVEEKNLAAKMEASTPLNSDDRDALVYILKGLKTSKAKWNYIFIFIFSALALLYDIFSYLLTKLN